MTLSVRVRRVVVTDSKQGWLANMSIGAHTAVMISDYDSAFLSMCFMLLSM